ncbi:MAG: 2OG-Fe dioxygenase family protein [Steroidobacteraceae bacterium]|jgi:hypothetical protein|nr:2OG-Fe dioxygenase family protein [Steroidobacteraceae bacterium]
MTALPIVPTLPPSWLEEGHARLADGAALLPGLTGLLGLAGDWESLPPDPWLRDGGRYRRRRHGCFVLDLDPLRLAAVPHRAHWQSTRYNALHGGMHRWFEPLSPGLAGGEALAALLQGLGARFAEVRRAPRWFIEVHQFRIDTTDGIGRPTPEGAHRDGVDFVAIVLVGRHALRGGETRVFPAEGATGGLRFTMTRPGETLLLDDTRVIHETTPIQPLEPGVEGRRDTLVITYRAGSFQGP